MVITIIILMLLVGWMLLKLQSQSYKIETLRNIVQAKAIKHQVEVNTFKLKIDSLERELSKYARPHPYPSLGYTRTIPYKPPASSTVLALPPAPSSTVTMKVELAQENMELALWGVDTKKVERVDTTIIEWIEKKNK